MTTPTRSVPFGAALFAVFLTLPTAAAAQGGCFTVTGQPARTQYVVGISTTLRLNARCQYAVTPAGPWVAAGALADRDTDFLEAFAHAAAQGSERGDPRLLLGRLPQARRGAAPVQHTLMLRYCAHYLLEEQLGFRVVPAASGESFRIVRTQGGSCDGDSVELRAVRGAPGERISAANAEQTLGASQQSLELAQGDWSIYAARPGGAAGLRVGVFRSQRVVTPLANHLRSVGLEPTAERPPPLLAARWDPGGPGLLLYPTEAALESELLWPELRTAADAGLLWLAERESGSAPQVIGPVQLEAGDPPAVRLPDTPVRAHMRSRYGAPGDALAPTPDDWQSIFGKLAVCLTPSYQERAVVAAGQAAPGACASLLGLTVLAQVEGASGATGRFCLRRGVSVMTANGARHDIGGPECFPLPAPGGEDRPPYRMAVVGDRIRVEGEGLCVLLDNRPLAGGEERTIDRSGLLEVRQGGGEDCSGRQSVARLRLPVIDPEREWHPVGLYMGATEAQMRCGPNDERSCPWRVLAHDESHTFAYVEPRNELEFRLSTSPQVAAAINSDPTQSVQIGQDVPVLSGIGGRLEGARESALVAYVAREQECPNGEGVRYSDLRERAPLDVDDLGPDAVFYVHLLSVQAEDRPVTCLARAAFRVRPSRALVNLTVEDFLGLEVGVLGDMQLVFFPNDPIALGLAWQLAWFRLTPGQRWLSFDIAANLVLAAAFPQTRDEMGMEVFYDASLSRVGASLSWALTFGVPDYVPRLLSVGGMLHLAAETSLIEDPIVSFFVGLNLASLIDLAGGR
jgi:hypothetical protein